MAAWSTDERYLAERSSGYSSDRRQLVYEISMNPGAEIEVVIGGRLHEADNDPGKGPERPSGKDRKFFTSFERKLSVDHDAFLRSHVFNGAPVLPVAVMFEWLAHGAGFVPRFNDLRSEGIILEKGGCIRFARHRRESKTQNVAVELRRQERSRSHSRSC
jgi:hypothetical protein